MRETKIQKLAADAAKAVGRLIGANASRSSREFLVAANESRVGTERWSGDVIISREAIFVFQAERIRLGKLGVILDLLADLLLPKKSLVGGPYTDIPQAIRRHPAWPVRHPPSCPVLLIPRTEARFLHHARGKLAVRTIFSGTEIAIPHGRFGSERIKAFLAANGWTLVWDGEPINFPPNSELLSGGSLKAMPFRKPYLSNSLIAAGFFLGSAPMLLSLLGPIDRDLESAVYFIGWIGGVLLVLFGAAALGRGF